MKARPTPEEFLARVRSERFPTDGFRLAVEALQPLTPDVIRRHLELLIVLARTKEA